MSDVASGIVGEPYTPSGRSAVFDVPSYDDVADLNVLFKRFADTAAGVGESAPTTLTDRSASFTVSAADAKARMVFLCSSASTVLATLPAASSCQEGERVSIVQGGAGKAVFSGSDLVGSPSTTGQYTGLSATVHGGKWWCLPFGSGSGPGPDPGPLLAPVLGSAVGGNGFVHLDWVPNPASSAASGFTVQYALASGGNWTSVDAGLVTSFNVPGLANGTAYRFQVAARNATETSAYSNQLTATPEADDPGELLPPRLDTASASDASVTLAWTPDPKCGTFTGYVLEWSVAGSGSWSSRSVAVVTSAVVDALKPGVEYSFRVRSTNAKTSMVSLPSNVLNAATKGALQPPVITRAAGGNQFVSLEWLSSGADATGYRVRHARLMESSWTVTDVGLVTSANVSPLVNGDSYRFQVQAYSAATSSTWSDEAIATPETDTPGELVPPTMRQAVSGDQKVTLSWDPPSGGGAFDSYVVDYSLAGSGQWSQLAVGLATSIAVNGLVNKKTYSFRARTATSSPQASSLPSNVLNATPGDGSTPNPPTISKVSAGNAQLTVLWTPPSSGPEPTSYVLEWAVASSKYEPMWPEGDPRRLGLTWQSKNVGLVTTSTIYDLTNDVTYLLRVRSVRASATSDPSATDSGTPTNPDPAGPSISGYDSTFETDDYVIYLFTAPGTRTMQVTGSGKAKILAVGAGGGRGFMTADPDLSISGWRYRGGSGGAGAVNCASKAPIPEFDLAEGGYTVVVGTAGAISNSESAVGGTGGASSVSGSGVSVSAAGGGGGGSALVAGSYAYSGGAGGGKVYWDAGSKVWSQAQPTAGGKGGQGRDGASARLSDQTSGGRIVQPGGGGGLAGSGLEADGKTPGDSVWPGWLPADTENEVWKTWVDRCSTWIDGITYGLAVGGSPFAPYADLRGAINDPLLTVYGKGTGPTADVNSKCGPVIHGVVAIGVKKSTPPTPMPDITGGSKLVVDGFVYHVFEGGGSYSLRVNGGYPIEGTAVVAEVLVVGGGGAAGGLTDTRAGGFDGTVMLGGCGGGGQVYLEGGRLPVVDLQTGVFQVQVAQKAFSNNRGDQAQVAGYSTVFTGPSADITALGGGGGNSGAEGSLAPSGGWSGGGGGAFTQFSNQGQTQRPGVTAGGKGSGGGAGSAGYSASSTQDTGGGGGSVKNAGPPGLGTSYGGTGWRPVLATDGPQWPRIFQWLNLGHVGCGGGRVANPDLAKDVNNLVGMGGRGSSATSAGMDGLVIVCYPVRPKAAGPARPAARKRSGKAVG